MEESSCPPEAEGDIFDQFDVQVTEKLLAGGESIVAGYFCRLPLCRGQERLFESRRALIMHRIHIHSLKNSGTTKMPEEDQIHQWLRSGKPRTHEIPQRSPESTESIDGPSGSPRLSLLSKLLLCKPDTESELQPATLESNIYEQFNVQLRYESGEGEADGEHYVEYVCLLSPCHEEKVCFNTIPKWTRHRRSVHKETLEVQTVTLPDGYEIREWVILNKPRPYEVPVMRKAWKKGKFCPVDPAVFAEFDVKGTVEDDELQYFCLLDPCKEKVVSFENRRCWRTHRVKYHMSPEYEDGVYTLPSKEIIRDWMKAGKPHHYRPLRRVRTFITVDPPRDPATTSTELHNPEVNPTPNNVGNEVDGQKLQVLCPLPDNQHSQGHHQGHQEEPHEVLTFGCRPSLRRSKSLARLGIPRVPTPPVEIPREPRRRRGRPRKSDAAGSSSDTEPAQKKKKTDSDSSDPVAIRVVTPGEDPSGSFWKQFMAEAANPTGDETPPSPDPDDGSENVGDLPMNQTVEDPNLDHNYRGKLVEEPRGDMEEFREEPREDSAQPEDALPSLPSSQPELHNSAAGDVVEVDEDDHKEFEAPDNALPSQPELQIVKVVGHSSIQPQDFQGVADEHKQNSTDAGMTKAGEEASAEFEATNNVLPSQPELQNMKAVRHSSFQPQNFQGMTDEHKQNSTDSEMTKAGEEASAEFEAQDNVLPSQAELKIIDVVHSSVQPQDFHGVTDERQQNSKTAEADEEAPKDSVVASENVLPSLQNSSKEDNPDCDVVDAEMGEVEAPIGFVSPENALNALTYLQPKLREHSGVQPQNFQGSGALETLPIPTAEMDEVEEETPKDSVATENSLSSHPGLQPKFGVTGSVEHDNVLPQEFPGEMPPNTQMAEFGEAHEESIRQWKLNPLGPFDRSEQTTFPPLWHLDGDTFECLPQDLLPGKNWPKLTKEYSLQTCSAEMAKVGENAPEEIEATGSLCKAVQYKSSEQNDLSILKHYFRDAVQFSPEVSPGELTDNLRPNSNAEMAGVSEEAPEDFVVPGNFMPWIPLVQSEGTKLPIAIFKDPIDFQAVSIQDFVPCVHMNQVFVIGPYTAGMAEVDEEAPEGFTVALDKLAPCIPLTQSEGRKLPSLEGPIDNQAAPIQESIPCVHMAPVFINGSPGMNEVGEEALEEFAAPGNFVPLIPYNARQETGEQIHDIPAMIEPVVVLPYAPSTQPEGRGIGRTFMEGSAENSTEYYVDRIQELTVTFMDVEGAFESVPDFPMIDDRLWNLEEFLHVEAAALSLQPMQQLFSPGNSESSTNFPADHALQTESSLMDMTGGLGYKLNMRLQRRD